MQGASCKHTKLVGQYAQHTEACKTSRQTIFCLTVASLLYKNYWISSLWRVPHCGVGLATLQFKATTVSTTVHTTVQGNHSANHSGNPTAHGNISADNHNADSASRLLDRPHPERLSHTVTHPVPLSGPPPHNAILLLLSLPVPMCPKRCHLRTVPRGCARDIISAGSINAVTHHSSGLGLGSGQLGLGSTRGGLHPHNTTAAPPQHRRQHALEQQPADRVAALELTSCSNLLSHSLRRLAATGC